MMNRLHNPNIAILASGSGSTAEAVIHATQADILDAEVGLVICNNPKAGVFGRVERLNKKYGLDIQTHLVSGLTHPDGASAKGEQTLAESEAICSLFDEANIGLAALLGYMKRIRGDLLGEYGLLPEHQSVLDARMLNTHPGPLPETKGLMGIHAQEKVLADGLGFSAQTLHGVAAEYDTGHIYRQHLVPVVPGDTAASLFDAVQLTEKIWLPVDIGDFLKDQVEFS